VPSPVAVADSYSGPHDHTLNVSAAQGVLANDYDLAGGSLAATIQPGLTQGTVLFNSDGSFSFQPTAGFAGTTSFSYVAYDSHGTSAPAVVTLTVTDQAPVAAADSYSVITGQWLNVSSAQGVLANDSDADGDTLTAQVQTQPAHGMLMSSNNGSVSYVPNSGFVGTDSWTYKASDGVKTSAAATVTVHVTLPPPPVGNDQDVVTAVNTPVSGNVTSTNSSGNTLTYSVVSSPSHGSLSLMSNGSFMFTPSSGYMGEDSFSFRANDGYQDGVVGIVSLVIHPTGPVALSRSYTAQHDADFEPDYDSNLLAGSVYDAAGAQLTAVLVTGPSHGTVTVDSDGQFTYTPAADYLGTDTFTYRTSDGTTLSSAATVTMTTVDDAPTATDDWYSISASSMTSITDPSESILANDDDSQDPLTATLTVGPNQGDLVLRTDGTFDYTPWSGFSGQVSFAYQAGDGLQVASATVHLVAGPVARADGFQVNHDQVLSVSPTISVLSNDDTNDGQDLTATLVATAQHGTLNFNADGSFDYTPAVGYFGMDSFTYQATDGVNSSNVATVLLKVVDTAPDGTPQDYQVAPNTTLTTNAANGLLATYFDAEGDSLQAILQQGPQHGSLTFHADGTFTYTPQTGYRGQDQIVYTIGDGLQQTGPITAHFSLTQQAQQPQQPDQDVTLAVTFQYADLSATPLNPGPFPIRAAKVHVVDTGYYWNSTIGTFYTSDTGRLIATLPHGTRRADGGYTSLRLIVYTDTAPPGRGQGEVFRATRVVSDAGTLISQADDLAGGPFVPRANAYQFTFTVGNSTVAAKAFWTFDAAVTATKIYATLPVEPGRVTVMYNLFLPTFALAKVHLNRADFDDWDTIIHEYGHIVAQQTGFFPFSAMGYVLNALGNWVGSPATHNLGENTRLTHPPGTVNRVARMQKDMKLAFQEGWANFYSMVAQAEDATTPEVKATAANRDGNQSRDGKYWIYTVETSAGRAGDPFADPNAVGRSAGEDEELSVMRLLWDLYDADGSQDFGMDAISYSFRNVFNWIMNQPGNPPPGTGIVYTLSDLWRNIVAWNVPQYSIDDFARVFTLNNVAPWFEGMTVGGAWDDVWTATDPLPSFIFDIPQGEQDPATGNPVSPSVAQLLNDAVIEFRDANHQLIRGFPVAVGANKITWTPTEAQWAYVTNIGGQVYCDVLGSFLFVNTRISGPYRSNEAGIAIV
jgi:VCBS repeat-containing protein